MDLSELEKARILLAHMLDHNRHHEEEMAALAKRFADAGDPATARKVRTAKARMVEADLALMEAVELAASKSDEVSAPEQVKTPQEAESPAPDAEKAGQEV